MGNFGRFVIGLSYVHRCISPKDAPSDLCKFKGETGDGRGAEPVMTFTAVCIIQGMRLFILKKNECLMNSISPSILHGMI